MSGTRVGRVTSATRSRRQPTGTRADIQALRAIAVGLVVLYHFFPGRMPGGFVGVDVFFVISGFLITSHLLSSPPRTWRALTQFWGRRIRRLLPASFLVLAVTLVATLLWAPETVWTNTAKQIAASALYVQNWFLSAEAVDYLAADTAPSAVQHFWSLSIEEQFYLVWPVLVMAAAFAAARWFGGAYRRTIGTLIAMIVVVSFAASVLITANNPAGAYFVTWTRAWELAIGGLAACVFPWVQSHIGARNGIRVVVTYIGLAGILVSGLLFSNALPFPGSVAALPVLATALVLVAAVGSGPGSPHRMMAWRPVQTAGDLSYSIYLWHWPAVVLLPFALGHSLRAWQKLLVIVIVIGLSWLTKRFIEDPFRGSHPLGVPLRRSFLFAAGGMLVIGLAAGAVVFAQQRAADAENDRVQALLSDPSSCFGSRALVNGDPCTPHGRDLITSPEFALGDKPDPYDDGCWILGDFNDQKTCHYGSDDPDATKIALVGNSHAGHWLPALQQIAETDNWSITTYLISECYTVDVRIQFETEERSDNCQVWNERTIEEVGDGRFDLVVFSNRTFRSMPDMSFEQSQVAAGEAYGRVLERWTSAGVPVLVLKDTPYAVELDSVPDCVASHLDDLAFCDGDRSREQRDPLADAAQSRTYGDRVTMLDLTDRICADDTCYSVVGGVIVYFDRGHLSATFSRSLTADIVAAAKDLLAAAN